VRGLAKFDHCASINGVNWRLFKGTVQSWTIFSFVAPSETTNYNSDLKPFFSVFPYFPVFRSEILIVAQPI
jgi:hypothetical protein